METRRGRGSGPPSEPPLVATGQSGRLGSDGSTLAPTAPRPVALVLSGACPRNASAFVNPEVARYRFAIALGTHAGRGGRVRRARVLLHAVVAAARVGRIRASALDCRSPGGEGWCLAGALDQARDLAGRAGDAEPPAAPGLDSKTRSVAGAAACAWRWRSRSPQRPRRHRSTPGAVILGGVAPLQSSSSAGPTWPPLLAPERGSSRGLTLREAPDQSVRYVEPRRPSWC
jgi:hypothetical protein